MKSSLHDIDGGWAWWVLGASFFCQLMCSGLAFVAGMFQVIFLEEFQGSVAFTSWVTGLFSALLQLAGPLSSGVSNAFSCRTSVMAGGGLLALGFFISGLAKDLEWLMVSFGAVAGVGLGMTYTSSIVVINYFFQKRRTLVNGIASSAGGLGIILAPQFSQLLFNNYTWREALFILAAVSIHICIAGALMFPNQKTLEAAKQESIVIDCKLKDGLATDYNNNVLTCNETKANCYEAHRQTNQNGGDSSSSVNTCSLDIPHLECTDNSLTTTNDCSKKLLADDDEEAKFDVHFMDKRLESNEDEILSHHEEQWLPTDKYARRHEPYSSIDNSLHGDQRLNYRLLHPNMSVNCPINSVNYSPSNQEHDMDLDHCLLDEHSSNVCQSDHRKETKDRQYQKSPINNVEGSLENHRYSRDNNIANDSSVHPKMIYPRLYRNRLFLVLCFALFVNNAGCGCFLIHVPSFLQSRGLADWEVTNVLSMNGVALLIGRCLVGALSNSHPGEETMLFIALQTIGGLVMMLYPVIGSGYASCMGLMFAIAIYCGTFHCLLPTLTIAFVGLKSMSTAIGMEMVCCGLGFLIAPPLAGMAVDYTGRQDINMYGGGFLFMLAGLISMALPGMAKTKG